MIGGGSGSYTVLKGLKEYPVQLFSIVSMFDSGGSTGRLRNELGVLPPGDVRRCVIALADEDNENVLRELFLYRFEGGVQDHSLGNLVLTAAEKKYGNIGEGIKKLSKVLNLRGQVLPVSLDNAQLCAKLEDGKVIRGETNIDIADAERGKISEAFLEPVAEANPDAKEAILDADVVIIGPGDLYTSLVPNLLVNGIPEALRKTRAKIVYVCNIMTKKGETDGFLASDFVAEIENYISRSVDHVICNENNLNRVLLDRYRMENKFPVVFDLAHDHRVMIADIVSQEDFLRHDIKKLARELISLC